MGGYIGTQPVPQATQTRDEFVATAGQTSFSTSGYTPNFLDVFLNGVKLAPSDYTATNGSDVVLDVGAAVDDEVSVIAYTTFTPAEIADIDTHLNTSTATTGEYLKWDGADYDWAAVPAGYTDADVDTHLNTSTASSGEVLQWDGADYDWAPVDAFPSGTKMLFQQTAAPTGWTKDTTHDNKALRVVSGTAGSGGTSSFTTIFANRTSGSTSAGGTVGSRTLSTAQMPSHNHQFKAIEDGPWTTQISTIDANAFAGGNRDARTYYTTSTGSNSSHDHSFSGSSHSHSLDMQVQYVDLIIATKN